MLTKEKVLNHPDLMYILKWAVKKMKVAHEEMDDVMQSAALSIAKSGVCETNTLTSNITQHVRWVLMRRNTKKTVKRKVNLTTNHLQGSMEKLVESPESFEAIEWFNIHKRKLNETEQIVLTSLFLEHETLESTGKKIGLTKERVRQIKEKALSRLRVLCNKNDLVRN